MYGYTKELDCSFDDAVSSVKDELSKEGFGVLTEIDVKATLKKKLDVDFDRYIILGACNPHLAHKALLAETEIGLLLPCNVIVYEKQDTPAVSAILPTSAMSMVDSNEIKEIAAGVEAKLKRVVDNVGVG